MIETPRLVLRGWRDEDIEPWCQMNADPRVREFFPDIPTRERSMQIAARMREELEARGFGWWVVEIKGGTGFAGVIQLQEVGFTEHFTPATEVGWRFLYDEWGNGYATEGAAAALRYGFDHLNLREIVAMTATSNLRSQRVMRRLGMRHDPSDDFDHPRLEPGHRLQRHVLYRIRDEDMRR